MDTVQEYIENGFPPIISELLVECRVQQEHPPIVDGVPDLDVRRLGSSIVGSLMEVKDHIDVYGSEFFRKIFEDIETAAVRRRETGAFDGTHLFNHFRIFMNMLHMNSDARYPWQKKPTWESSVANVFFDTKTREQFTQAMGYHNSTTVPQRIAGTKLIVATLFKESTLLDLRHISGGSSLDYTLAMLHSNEPFLPIEVSDDCVKSPKQRQEFEKLIDEKLRTPTQLRDSYGIDLLPLDHPQRVAYAEAGMYPHEIRNRERMALLARLKHTRDSSDDITHVTADITNLVDNGEIQDRFPGLQPDTFDSADLTTVLAQLYPEDRQAALLEMQKLLHDFGVVTITEFVDISKMDRERWADIREMPHRSPTSVPYSYNISFLDKARLGEGIQQFGYFETGRARRIWLTDLGKACLKGEYAGVS